MLNFASKNNRFACLIAMIEKISVKNFLSFKEEIVFDFSASQEKPKKGFEYMDWFVETNKKKILKAQFLFGNNGTGKSNFIALIKTLRLLVCRNSQSKSQGEFQLPYSPFKLSEETKKQPSHIGIVFYVNDIRYSYDVEWKDSIILLENLEKKQGKSKSVCIFRRSFDKEKDMTNVVFPSKSINAATQSIIKENAINNSSVISIYDGKNIEAEDLKNVFSYFSSIMILDSLENIDLLSMLENRKDSINLKTLVLALLKDFGSNIVDYEIDCFEIKINDQEARLMRSYLGNERFEKEFPTGCRKAKSIRFAHFTENPNQFGWLTENEESLGTINMIKLMIALYDGCASKSAIFIDECSYGIHQLTFGRIVQFFLAASIKTQAFMASQNLSIMDMEGFRRDTIKIFDKNRTTGETYCQKIDLRKYHKNQSIVRAYLDHSFGSLPDFPTQDVWVKHLLQFRKNVIDEMSEE